MLTFPQGHAPRYRDFSIDAISDETMREGGERAPFGATNDQKIQLIRAITDAGITDIDVGSGITEASFVRALLDAQQLKSTIAPNATFSFNLTLKTWEPLCEQLERELPSSYLSDIYVSIGMIEIDSENRLFERVTERLRSIGVGKLRSSLLNAFSITVDELLSEAGTRGKVTSQFVTREILSDAQLAYERRERQLGEPAMRELERRVVLSVIDRRWRDHLYEMDYLKDGIGLRAMAQRDPLVEYQREGFALYQSMMGSIREESVGFLFNLEVEVTGGASVEARGLAAPQQNPNQLSYSAPSADAQGEVEVRNQRGQIEQAATARAQQAQAQQQRPLQAPPAQQGGARGAFGQRSDGGAAPAPANRAERRAQEKKGR